MSIEWKPIETFKGASGAPFLIWDKHRECAVVAHRTEGSRRSWWMINDSYGFNEDGEIPHESISHWAVIEGPR